MRVRNGDAGDDLTLHLSTYGRCVLRRKEREREIDRWREREMKTSIRIIDLAVIYN